MDGKRPETTGGSLPVDSRSKYREKSLSISDKSSSFLEKDRKNFDDSIPEFDWNLLSKLSLPNENTSLSLHDGKGVFLKVTGGYENLWKRSEEEILDQRITDFIETNENFTDWFLDLKSDSKDSIFKANSVVSQSDPVPISLKRVPLFIGSQPSHSRILLKAVADDKNSRPEILNSISFNCDINGEFLEVNEAWTTCLGVPKEELEKQNLIEAAHREERNVLSEYLDTLQKVDESQTRTFRFNSSAGSERTILLTGSFSHNQFEFLAKDITLDPVAPKASLQSISAKLSTTALAWVDVSNSNCEIDDANYAFEQMTGFRKPEKPSLAELFGENNYGNEVSKALSLNQGNTDDAFELQMYRKNGDRFWASLNIYPLRDQTGTTHYNAFSVKDITKEKESQKTAIQQENLRSLGQMASGIAHDFNNLLAPILGFSELLLNMPNGGRDDKKLISFLEKIKVAAQDGAAVVGRLREFYCNQDSSEDTTSNIDLHMLAQQVRDLTQHRWKSQAEARGANIEFRAKVESSHFVHGNEPELRQALSNLVINAADAIDGDGVISLSMFDIERDICIKIEDTGCGMPEKIRSKCLDPFYSTKGKLGTGLGLSIVAGIVKRHNGDIKIESVEGEGSTIIIRLPAADAEPKKISPKQSQKSSDSLRIMLVDDEAVLLEVLSELLGSGGHRVTNFEDGEAALEAFKKERFDLVITDRAMPNMSGDQLASKIKAINPHTPIIMATGFGDMMSEDDENSKNVDLVLAKPVPLNVLNDKLSELTSRELN